MREKKQYEKGKKKQSKMRSKGKVENKGEKIERRNYVSGRW